VGVLHSIVFLAKTFSSGSFSGLLCKFADQTERDN
jgi:hypothetical protein